MLLVKPPHFPFAHLSRFFAGTPNNGLFHFSRRPAKGKYSCSKKLTRDTYAKKNFIHFGAKKGRTRDNNRTKDPRQSKGKATRLAIAFWHSYLLKNDKKIYYEF